MLVGSALTTRVTRVSAVTTSFVYFTPELSGDQSYYYTLSYNFDHIIVGEKSLAV